MKGSGVQVNLRIEKLREFMKQREIDIYLVFTEDYHGSEYVHDYFKTREFMTGFTGSNGTLLVTMKEALLWTDGRYFIQAENELLNSEVVLCKMKEPGVPTILEYLTDNLHFGGKIAVDGRCVSFEYGSKLAKVADSKGAVLEYDIDLVSQVWDNDREVRRELPCGKVFSLSEELIGESVLSTLKRVRDEIQGKGCDSLFLSKLDDIMWLYHIRGCDVECNPVALSYAVLTMKESYLFIQEESLSNEIKEKLEGDHIIIYPYESFFEFVEGFHITGSIMAPKDEISYFLGKKLEAKMGEFIDFNPISLMKAIKSDTEIKHCREIYIKDSVAVIKFIYWLKNHIKNPIDDSMEFEEITETKAAEYLDKLRSEIPEYIELSFPTISAYGENAAMMHYVPDAKREVILKNRDMLLVDSGGQYFGGTTDITRTIVLGEVTDRQKLHFTATVKGMLRLANAKFLHGCTGRNLDILAREPLWEHGIDYKCGTGHGIGYMLNVHEGPQRISFHYNKDIKEAILEPGMLVSDEPGVYIPGEYGIRIENILLCSKGNQTSDGQFLYFETLTFVPIDIDGIDLEQMEERDIRNLNEYHEMVYEKTSEFLSKEEKEWLYEVTRPIEVLERNKLDE